MASKGERWRIKPWAKVINSISALDPFGSGDNAWSEPFGWWRRDTKLLASMSMVWTIASLLTYNERIYEHSNPLRIEDFIPQVPSIMMVAIRGVRIDWKWIRSMINCHKSLLQSWNWLGCAIKITNYFFLSSPKSVFSPYLIIWLCWWLSTWIRVGMCVPLLLFSCTCIYAQA